MARIYQPQDYGDNFQGAAQSRGFQAVQAVNRSNQEKQKAQQAIQNIDTEIKVLGRKQALESTEMQGQQAVERSNQQGQAKVMQGIMSLSQTALKGVQMVQQEGERIEQENGILDAIGLNNQPDGGSQLNPQDFNDAQDVNTQIGVQSTAIDQTATEVESSGSLMDKDVGNQLRQSSAYVQAQGIRGNVYQARSGHRIFMQEALNAIPDAQKPRSMAEAQALVRALNRQFLSAAGLLDPSKRSLIARELGPTILNNNANIEAQLVASAIKADQTENMTQVSSNIYNSVASDASAAEVWQTASEGMAHGNVGHKGFSAASNQAAMEAVIEQAKADGDVQLLQDLMTTPKIPGQPNGPTLGDAYGHLLGPAVASARSTRNSEISSIKTEQNRAATEAVQAYYDNPSQEAKGRLIEQLQAMPQTASVRQELQRITAAGFNNDPELEADFARRAARGEFIGQDELQEALDSGRIRPEVYQQHAKSHVDIKNEAKAREVTKELMPIIQNTVLGGARTADMPATTRTVFNMRTKMFQDELTSLLAAEARSNPELLTNIQERNRVATELMQQLSTRPEYTLITDPVQGIKFAADPGFDSEGYQKITIVPGEQDFRGLDLLKVTKAVPLSEINPTDDFLVKPDILNESVNHLLGGGNPDKLPGIVHGWARTLGVSPRALVDAQLQRYGKPSIKLLEQNAGKAATPGADLNAATGYQHLQSMGVPTRGAAYLTSAISHESAWNGEREWGQVAGDGTNRNGGLVSWASWSNDSARLGAIERHFGRNISQISETDQLDYMLNVEMNRGRFKQYRAVFMDPNASSADLRWAVSGYWGFDPKYTGNRWSDAEAMIAGKA